MAGPAGGGANPINVINNTEMNWRQWAVVVLMVLLNALDGFDVLSSAFAAPGISACPSSDARFSSTAPASVLWAKPRPLSAKGGVRQTATADSSKSDGAETPFGTAIPRFRQRNRPAIIR